MVLGGDWVQLLGMSGARAHVILVLRECILNATAVSFVLPTSEESGSLGFSLRRVIHLLGFILGECLPFPYGE